MTKRPALINLARHTFPYVTPPELAAYLRCDQRTIVRMIREGTLPADRVGRNWHIAIEDARAAFPRAAVCYVEPTRQDTA